MSYGYLMRTAKEIRRARPLKVQQQIARSGENPMTGRWWPRWKPWTHTTDMIASIMSRFTKGPNGSGARAARAQRGNASRRTASRQNARRPRPRARKALRQRTPSSPLPLRQHSRTTGSASGPIGNAQAHEERPR
jgi:hypothetical protein